MWSSPSQPVYQEDEVSWTVMSNDVLFGDSLKAENFIVINPMNTKGELITHNLERDKTYLGAAIINYVHGQTNGDICRSRHADPLA